ncbi:MAG: hypothetical protein OZ913_05895 [Ignavibacteriaceae bacterium]|jgi:DNA-3-methyladenine glycosylase II (EC 3.2.2.21)|nr:MAG: DNA-3-methyladenine glycosylase [Chlorobi bacterium OLB4]MBW7856069.1 DNA-3-methyladenine glycosylase 2 family protein [Ignavibacteria bacterium]MEB2329817.1 hypothetical protein [Ignavibacteriaceae bacterium]OQY77434.1 MAG: 3-methyladenine DNA glycosylase [Ignavibacteriales bacterium UTCHB1]
MLNDYKAHLSKDKRLKVIISGEKEFRLKRRKNLFLFLCESIMGQQLSGKVADIIYDRFLELFEDKKPTPELVSSLPDVTLRKIGLSNNKSSYVKNVATFAIKERIDFKTINKMDNESIIKYLTQIKGVGRWTVEMLLIFALGREDVFAVDDYGIQSAMIKIFNLEHLKNKELKDKLKKISNRWSPYRTYACLYLWHWKDNVT